MGLGTRVSVDGSYMEKEQNLPDIGISLGRPIRITVLLNFYGTGSSSEFL